MRTITMEIMNTTTAKMMTWRELDDHLLKFKSSQWPAARYLYFHYCLQVLRHAWKAHPGQGTALSLADG